MFRKGEIDFCEDSVIGKTHKVSFGQAKHVTKGKLDYIHSDLWGSPNVPPSLSNSQYFLSFTDDWSRKVCVYFLKTKDEAFDRFVEWKKMVEVQSERRVKRLRTYNGLEFCNRRFDSFCKEEGIVRHKTCTYTPQQNGIAERLNRTIMNKVRSILSESGLEKKFWAEAAATSVYIINRTPSSAIEFDIPEERWTSVTPNLSSLKRFGCIAYIHSTEGKLDPRVKKGVFVGYPEGVKGYKVWVIEDERCVISRNVVFREDVMFKSSLTESEAGTSKDTRLLTNQVLSFYDAGDLRDSDTNVQGGASHGVTQEEEKENTNEVEESQEKDLSDYQLARDRSRREIRAPVRLEDYQVYPNDEDTAGYAYLVVEDAGRTEPRSYQEALEDPDRDLWLGASDEEMESLKKNKTWVLVDRVMTQRPIGCKWVFKRKDGISGVEPPRYKGRLVAKGYSQKEGIDYQEIFSPVAKHVSFRCLLSMVVHHDMELQQMDVKTAFLHGYLDETIYMEQPEGYVDKKHPDKVCLLKRSLYGLKQSPRQWNTRFDELMAKHGYSRSDFDLCVYFKQMEDEQYVYLLLYVDDILISSKVKDHVLKLKELLSAEFEMKDLGEAKKILGMEIVRDKVKGSLTISQGHYLQKVLDTYGMDQANSVQTPMGVHFKLRSATEKEYREQQDRMRVIPYQNVVGSLMYAMTGTRPDLAYAVGLVCRFMSKPLKEHWLAVKWVMRYIKGTRDVKLCYTNEGDFEVEGYCDSDYGGDLDWR